jgi:hypothetical protein
MMVWTDLPGQSWQENQICGVRRIIVRDPALRAAFIADHEAEAAYGATLGELHLI